MTTIVVLFNLRDAQDVDRYEVWARTVDRPTVKTLKSIKDFEVLKAQGVFGGGRSPYQYIELIRVADMGQFTEDVASAQMRQIASQFQQFAQDPVFIITEQL
jgi:hypothetical protein